MKARGQVGLLERLQYSLYTLGLVVTNPLINPSHGGTYVVEGCLLLGSDWLIVVHEPCLSPSFIHRRKIVTVRRTFLSPLLSRASEWPLSFYHVIFVIRRLLVLLTWYLVSHDGLDLCTDLSPCLLMFQGVLSCSIPHSYCTRIEVLTLVDNY